MHPTLRTVGLRLCATLALVGAGACGTWHSSTAPGRVPLDSTLNQADAEAGPVRLTLTNGQRVKLDEAVVLDDTLFGVGEKGETHDIPVADVKKVETWKPDEVGTDVLLGVGGLAITFGLTVVIGAALSAIGG